MSLIHWVPATGARLDLGEQAYFDRTAHRHHFKMASVGTNLETKAV
jgi:hypothetical protein